RKALVRSLVRDRVDEAEREGGFCGERGDASPRGRLEVGRYLLEGPCRTAGLQPVDEELTADDARHLEARLFLLAEAVKAGEGERVQGLGELRLARRKSARCAVQQLFEQGDEEQWVAVAAIEDLLQHVVR